MEQCFATAVLCFTCRTYTASGHDMHSLLFNFLDELLFVFSTELFVPLELRITDFNRTEWQLEATGYARSSNFTSG
jgi:SHS2 domain-containing protein